MVAEEIPENIQRWTTDRRAALTVRILEDETSVQAARELGLNVAEIEGWKGKFILGAQNALGTKPRNEEGVKDGQIKRLGQKVGASLCWTSIS